MYVKVKDDENVLNVVAACFAYLKIMPRLRPTSTKTTVQESQTRHCVVASPLLDRRSHCQPLRCAYPMLQGECQRLVRLREEISRTSNALLLISFPQTITLPAAPPESTYTLAFCAAPYRPTSSHRSKPNYCMGSAILYMSRVVLAVLLPQRVGFLLSSDVVQVLL